MKNFTIKNFRIFDAEGATFDIAPLTIFTGCNSSGKSSFTKLWMLLQDFFQQMSTAIKKEQFVRTMPMMDTNYIIKHAEKLVESFGIRMEIPYTCSLCGLDYNSIFRVTKEFFGPTIDF